MLYSLEHLFTSDSPQIRLKQLGRSVSSRGDLSLILDKDTAASCLFIRVTGSAPVFRLSGTYQLGHCHAGGWMLTNHTPNAPSYWLPAPATFRRVSAQGHILEERAAEWHNFELDSSGATIAYDSVAAGWALDAVIWQINDATLIDELQRLDPIEVQGYFLLGSHSRYSKPADLFRHLIHGWVYEDRYAWPHFRKICSENDAHALHLILSGLQRATGKQIYGLLKTQLQLSVLSRQGGDGAWRHGEWTDRMESHFRLHASAMHLLMDAHDEDADPVIRHSLDQAQAFLAKQREPIRFGEWFLHDELELSEASMHAAPFKWIVSRALGKSPGNMLVLNSHLDTTVGLSRYNDLAGDRTLEATLDSARSCTIKVLQQRPAEWLYRMLMAAIRPTFLPSAEAAQLPLWRRILKRLGWKYLIPLLPRIKAQFPRLVMPGGYIDRELTLQTWAHHYLGINLMDLARHQRRYPEIEIEALMRETVDFGRGSGILRRWMELKYEKYALGFWAEALYHLCMLYPAQIDYRDALGEVMLLLEDSGQGQPPSLLGANAEVVPIAQQVPCPRPTNARLRVANLSNGDRIEFLILNPTDSPQAFGWKADRGALMSGDIVPSRAWLKIYGGNA